jgi:hypothetical protein
MALLLFRGYAMDEEDQDKPTPVEEETERDPKPVPDWTLTLEGDERTAEEAGYGYGV